MSPEAKAWHDSWEKYKTTEMYWGGVRAMMANGMKQPYIDNILRRAYDDAWWACKDQIKPVQVEKIVVKKVVEYRKEPPIIHPYKKKQ